MSDKSMCTFKKAAFSIQLCGFKTNLAMPIKVAATTASLLLLTLGTKAQKQPKEILPPSIKNVEKIQVMVMGTYHFNNPNRDEYNVDAADVMTPARQKQIREVVDNLAEFEPSKVTLEYVRKNAAKFDSLYKAYRSGDHDLERNERQQIGFRLADEMGHNRVYAVDFNYSFPIDEVKEFAGKQDQEFLEYLKHWGRSLKKEADSLQRHGTVAEALRSINSPYFEDAQRQMYARTATVGNDTAYPGVELVTNWHRRNLRIFANMEHIAEPGDRVFLMFGSGHSAILRDLVEAHPQMVLVDPLDYLQIN